MGDPARPRWRRQTLDDWTPRIGEAAARSYMRLLHLMSRLWISVVSLLVVKVFVIVVQPPLFVDVVLYSLAGLAIVMVAVEFARRSARTSSLATAFLGVDRKAVRRMPLGDSAKFDQWNARRQVPPTPDELRSKDRRLSTWASISAVIGAGGIVSESLREKPAGIVLAVLPLGLGIHGHRRLRQRRQSR